jgi:hypothetical protein
MCSYTSSEEINLAGTPETALSLKRKSTIGVHVSVVLHNRADFDF